MSEYLDIVLTVNGTAHRETIPANLTLVDFLREHLGLLGTKGLGATRGRAAPVPC